MTAPPARSLNATNKKRQLEAALKLGRDQLDRGEGKPLDVKRLTKKLARRVRPH